MILECAHCGAPLDVPAGSTTSRCRYCGHTSRVEELRTVFPQRPPDWRPPRKWTPPQHAPADSRRTLTYQGASNTAGVFIMLGIFAVVGVGIAAAVFAAARSNGGSAIPGLPGAADPKVLDAVRLDRDAKTLANATGGKDWEGRSVNLPLSGLFDYAVFGYDEKEPGHANSFGFYRNQKGCPAEFEAIRAKLKKRLGKRFDGKNWRWGSMFFGVDEKCAWINASFSASPSDDPGDWKPAFEALFAELRSDIYGRGEPPSKDDLVRYLARGYDTASIAPIVAGTTIDDVSKVQKSLPAATGRKISDVELSFPLDNPRFGQLTVTWKNEKAGPIDGVRLDGYDNKLTGHLEVAQCLAQKLGAKLDVRDTDYVNKKKDAYVRWKNVQAYVSEYGASLSSLGFDGIPADVVRAFIEAGAACS